VAIFINGRLHVDIFVLHAHHALSARTRVRRITAFYKTTLLLRQINGNAAELRTAHVTRDVALRNASLPLTATLARRAFALRRHCTVLATFHFLHAQRAGTSIVFFFAQTCCWHRLRVAEKKKMAGDGQDCRARK